VPEVLPVRLIVITAVCDSSSVYVEELNWTEGVPVPTGVAVPVAVAVAVEVNVFVGDGMGVPQLVVVAM